MPSEVEKPVVSNARGDWFIVDHSWIANTQPGSVSQGEGLDEQQASGCTCSYHS